MSESPDTPTIRQDYARRPATHLHRCANSSAHPAREACLFFHRPGRTIDTTVLLLRTEIIRTACHPHGTLVKMGKLETQRSSSLARSTSDSIRQTAGSMDASRDGPAQDRLAADNAQKSPPDLPTGRIARLLDPGDGGVEQLAGEHRRIMLG